MLERIRRQVIDSFDETYDTFSHVIPFHYTNFIDGKAWLTMTCVACYLAGDIEIYQLCFKWLRLLNTVGKNARNFAPYQVKDSWKQSKTIPPFWYKEKPQGFAAPCAAAWANKQGVPIECSKSKKWIKTQAKAMCFVAPLFGYLIRYIPYLRQHINSVMMAHLLLDRKPPESMRFLAKDNMIYSYQYGIKCDTLYPDDEGIWAAKNYSSNKKSNIYTPICNLTGIYLQKELT